MTEYGARPRGGPRTGRDQQKQRQNPAEKAGQQQQARYSGRSGPQRRGGEQLDIAASDEAAREQQGADNEYRGTATDRCECSGEARCGGEIQRPQNAEPERYRVRDDKAAEVLTQQSPS